MERLFILALLGHLIGDYLLQTKPMALNKSAKGNLGLIACTTHVAIYTAAVCAMCWTLSPLFALAVFVPHWIIDRWSLATPWLRMINGRTFEKAQGQWDVAFTAIVYTVADNTMHLLCLWAAIIWLL